MLSRTRGDRLTEKKELHREEEEEAGGRIEREGSGGESSRWLGRRAEAGEVEGGNKGKGRGRGEFLGSACFNILFKDSWYQQKVTCRFKNSFKHVETR